MTRILLSVVLLLGISAPVFAQVDLTGTWATRNHEDWMERWPGPDVGDYTGLPINSDGRARGLSYSASMLSLPERQCLYYGPNYTTVGPFGIRLWSESEPVDGQVVAWKMSGAVDKTPRTIWMDARSHPSPNTLRTFDGFSTGRWAGTTLVVTTTHMKTGLIRRNGVPLSDEAVMTEYISRYGDKLTILAITDDPAYLAEPHVISRTWEEDESMTIPIYPRPCIPVIEAPGLSAGAVPHYLPGENPFEGEMMSRYGLPLEAVQGGPETLYPEFREVLEELYNRPAECGRYCCGWDGGSTGPNGGDQNILACVSGDPALPPR